MWNKIKSFFKFRKKFFAFFIVFFLALVIPVSTYVITSDIDFDERGEAAFLTGEKVFATGVDYDMNKEHFEGHEMGWEFTEITLVNEVERGNVLLGGPGTKLPSGKDMEGPSGKNIYFTRIYGSNRYKTEDAVKRFLTAYPSNIFPRGGQQTVISNKTDWEKSGDLFENHAFDFDDVVLSDRLAKDEHEVADRVSEGDILLGGPAAVANPSCEDGELSAYFTRIFGPKKDDTRDEVKRFLEEQFPVYTITYFAGEGGTVSGDDEVIMEIPRGDSGGDVRAIADEGYEFVKWDDESTDRTHQVTNARSDLDFKAIFESKEYEVRYYVDGEGGTINGQEERVFEVEYGLDVGEEIVAEPKEGFEFLGWDDDYYEPTRGRDVDENITQELNLEAIFLEEEKDEEEEVIDIEGVPDFKKYYNVETWEFMGVNQVQRDIAKGDASIDEFYGRISDNEYVSVIERYDAMNEALMDFMNEQGISPGADIREEYIQENPEKIVQVRTEAAEKVGSETPYPSRLVFEEAEEYAWENEYAREWFREDNDRIRQIREDLPETRTHDVPTSNCIDTLQFHESDYRDAFDEWLKEEYPDRCEDASAPKVENGKRESACAPYGDITGDGYITQEDVDRVEDMIGAGREHITETGLKIADVTCTGSIDEKDREMLSMYLAGDINTLDLCNPQTNCAGKLCSDRTDCPAFNACGPEGVCVSGDFTQSGRVGVQDFTDYFLKDFRSYVNNKGNFTRDMVRSDFLNDGSVGNWDFRILHGSLREFL